MAFKPSYQGIGDMLNSPDMVKEMHRRAEKVKTAAEAASPVGDPAKDKHAGRYKASFSVSSGTHGGYHHDRAYGRVTNDSPEALWVELGSKNSPKYRPLGRGLSAAGE